MSPGVMAFFLLVSSAPVVATAPRQGVAAETQATQAQLADGRMFSAAQASSLEAQVAQNPNDRASRTRLLGYYAAAVQRDRLAGDALAARRGHILWFIEHEPKSALALAPESRIDRDTDPAGFDAGKSAWLAQIERQPNEVPIRLRAALFIRTNDPAGALDVLKPTLSSPLAGEHYMATSAYGATAAFAILGVTRLDPFRQLAGAIDPAAIASDRSKNVVEELRRSNDPNVVEYAGRTLGVNAAVVTILTGGRVNMDPLAEELLKRAVEMQPPSMLAPQYLAEFYRTRARATSAGTTQQELNRQWLAAAWTFVDRAKTAAARAPVTRWAVLASLEDAMNAATAAGELERALQYGEELLAQPDLTPQRAKTLRDTVAALARTSPKYVEDVHLRAAKGDAAAQYEYGQALWNGQGVREDDLAAVVWIRKAAEQGHVPAERQLGLIYGGYQIIQHLYGAGPQQNLGEAAKWYTRAAEHGDVDSQVDLAVFYWNGHGVRQSWTEGTKWLLTAAEAGHLPAQDKLSWAYFNGKGVDRNPVEAYKWLDIAIRLGSASSAVSESTRAERANGLETITRSLKAEDLARAKKLSEDWRAAFALRKK